MLRIRRKFTLILCALFVILFLTLYLLINLIPIEKQARALEKSIHAHRDESFDSIPKAKWESNYVEPVKSKSNSSKLHLKVFSKIKKALSRDGMNTCPSLSESAPKPDIQMLSLYETMTFDNPDGGPWKQGWRIQYDPLEYNNHHKLKVFVVPHSHNDPGWIKTFDVYYEHTTKHILSNMLRHLTENPSMKFIWAEISYFAKFYENSGEKSKEGLRKLVENGQLEFVSGGWVMPDEANSHWLSLLIQLREGQDWLKTHFNVTPKAAWSIDPFGNGPTMPYLLKKSGISNLLIQRSHYAVKKRLAKTRELEFRWRQLWSADSEASEMMTHMMPFYSYDVPHTCGPDPKVCCQFDFKRLPGFGLTCPWRAAPQEITDDNVDKRAELIVDQWKKKSQLYRTNSVLIPLGDDFRFSQSTEWEAQRRNYEKLFDHINNEPKYFTVAKFGTLGEYFNSVASEKRLEDFPTLTGDFFTYADRDDHYWSGYYTSRPYHKRMDRVLLHYIRSADMLFSWSKWEAVSNFHSLLQNARRQLSLFQHHDGITGTAKTHVVKDYFNRMQESIRACKLVMQQAAYRLLTQPNLYKNDYKFTYFHLDDSRWPGPDEGRTTIILGRELPTKFVVLHNSLAKWREEIVDFHVSTPFVFVADFNNNKIKAQVSPIWTWHGGISSTVPQSSTTKYRLLFRARVPPMGLATYVINYAGSTEEFTYTNFTKNLILTNSPFSINIGDYPQQIDYSDPREVSLSLGGPTATFTKLGLLKSISATNTSAPLPAHLEFVKYGTRTQGGNSGAYLFLPDGPAVPLMIANPTILVTEGPLESTITVGLPFATHQTVVRSDLVEIRNFVDIGTMDNTEIAMRISTNIDSGPVFYTDLNGISIIKRKIFTNLPLQANYYPIPSAMYIQDKKTRLTLLSAQPLGGSSLKSGQMEIMQDRRLSQDDERGLGQGVLDNQPVLHVFRLLVENVETCLKRASSDPNGYLTAAAHSLRNTALHPIDKMIWNENNWEGAEGWFGTEHEPVADNIHIGLVQNIPTKEKWLTTGVVLHRTNFESCQNDEPLEPINFKRLFNLHDDLMIFSSNLTLLARSDQIASDEVEICPMDTKAFIIQR